MSHSLVDEASTVVSQGHRRPWPAAQLRWFARESLARLQHLWLPCRQALDPAVVVIGACAWAIRGNAVRLAMIPAASQLRRMLPGPSPGHRSRPSKIVMFCALVALLVLDQENARVAAQERDPLAPPPIARPREILPELDGIDEAGVASVYSDVFQGHRTASGELYDREQFTAAHKTLPFGTRVRVTHKRSGRTVEVRINDRGPHLPGRVIDLSPRAAGALGMHALGLAAVELQILETPRCATADGKRRGRRTCPSEDAPDTRPTVPRTITE